MKRQVLSILGSQLPCFRFLLMVLCVAAAFTLYLFTPLDTGLYGRQLALQSQIDAIDGQRDMLQDPTVPDDLRSVVGQSIAVLERLREAKSDRELISCQHELNELDRISSDAGYLVGVDEVIAQWDYEYFSSLNALADPQLYETSNQLPGLLYLGFMACVAPFAIWVAPGLVLGLGCASLFDRGKLLSRSPLSSFQRMLALSLSLLVLSAVAVCMICAVPFAISSILNGLGDPAYPVMFLQGNELVSLSSAELAGRIVVLYALVTWAVGCLVSFLGVISRRAIASFVIAAVVVCLPLVLNVFADSGQYSGLLALAVPEYFDVASCAGVFLYGPFEDIQPIAGITYERSLAVVGATIFVLTFLPWGIDWIRARLNGGARHAES